MVNAIWLDNWDVVGIEHDGRAEATVEYTVDPEACLKCGCIGRLYSHGPQPREYRDTPAFGERLALMVNVRRYMCRECGKTFMQPLPDMDDERRMTNRLKAFVETESLIHTFSYVAEMTGLDERTVREISYDRIDVLSAQHRPYSTTTIGLDETKLAGKLRVMVIDLDRNRPIDMLEHYTKAHVSNYLANLPGKEMIKFVIIDMSSMFKEAVREGLPNAYIVVDRFHVVRAATGALNSIRIAKGNSLKVEAEAAATVKERRKILKEKKAVFRSRRLLTTNPKNLTSMQLFKLDGWLLNDPDIKAAYEAKEAFLKIWDAEDVTDAAEMIDVWLENVPEASAAAFKPAIRAFEDWRMEMLAFWGSFTTNGFTESNNGMAKIMSRAGRGYKYPVIRARVLFGGGVWHPDDLVKCEKCGDEFPGRLLIDQRITRVGRGPLRREIILCAECSVNHINPKRGRNRHSTPKSG